MAGQYWFGDGWTQELDYNRIDLPHGTKALSIIPLFTWPETGLSYMENIIFWGAILNDELTMIDGRRHKLHKPEKAVDVGSHNLHKPEKLAHA